MTKVYIIAGEDAVGKTSIIRNIVGKKSHGKDIDGIKQLLTTNCGHLDCFYKSKSLQEENDTTGIQVQQKGQIAPADVQTYIQNNAKAKGKVFAAILIALRTDSYNKMPIAEKYIDVFVQNPSIWTIEGIVELVNSPPATTLQTYCQQNPLLISKYQPYMPISQWFANVKTNLGF
jgi:GTPase SAR1 family protein